MKLFAVELKTIAIVWAEDGYDAERVAEYQARDIVSDTLDMETNVVDEITKVSQLQVYEYGVNSLVYSDVDEQRTIGELLNANN